MGAPRRRFIATAEPGGVWRIHDKKTKRIWGPALSARPDELLTELNGDKRPDRVNELLRRIQIAARS